MGGVLLDEIQLPLAALEDGVVGDLAPLIVAGPGDDLAVDGAGQVIRGAQVVSVVVGVQLTPAVQQGGGAVLNALDHDGEPGLVTVDVAVGEAVDLLLHQGLVVLAGDVYHELLDNGGGFLRIAAGRLVLVAIAVALVAVVAVAAACGRQDQGGFQSLFLRRLAAAFSDLPLRGRTPLSLYQPLWLPLFPLSLPFPLLFLPVSGSSGSVVSSGTGASIENLGRRGPLF